MGLDVLLISRASPVQSAVEGEFSTFPSAPTLGSYGFFKIEEGV